MAAWMREHELVLVLCQSLHGAPRISSGDQSRTGPQGLAPLHTPNNGSTVLENLERLICGPGARHEQRPPRPFIRCRTVERHGGCGRGREDLGLGLSSCAAGQAAKRLWEGCIIRCPSQSGLVVCRAGS